MRSGTRMEDGDRKPVSGGASDGCAGPGSPVVAYCAYCFYFTSGEFASAGFESSAWILPSSFV